MKLKDIEEKLDAKDKADKNFASFVKRLKADKSKQTKLWFKRYIEGKWDL